MTRKRRACRTGKVRYHDQAEAKRAITNVRFGLAKRTLEDTGVTPKRTYRCPLCGGWHLTSEPQRTPEPMENR